jgi:hypothetical protein
MSWLKSFEFTANYAAQATTLLTKKRFLLTTGTDFSTACILFAIGLTTTLAVVLSMCRLRNAIALRVAIVAISIGSIRLHELAAAQPVRDRSPQRTVQLQRSVSIHWERVPLRDAVERVSKSFGEAVFTDRRVDPDRRVTLQLEAKAIDQVLQSIADTQSLGVSRLKGVRYLGPRHAAELLRTAAVLRGEEIARLNSPERQKLERTLPLNWPQRSEPRELVISLARQRGWRITRAERIPHDLWVAGALPELSAAEQLTLLLIGFDLSFKTLARERSLEIVPLEQVTIRREYRLPYESSENALLRQELSAAKSARRGARTLIVEARVEQHERLAELFTGRTVRPRARRPTSELEHRYTLRVQDQPVGGVIRQLAERMSWPVEFDEASIQAAGLSLDTRISFSVENSNQEGLLDAMLAPAGLDYRREGERLIVVPRAVRP